MRVSRTGQKRGGATTVEFALVSIMLFLMLFGIFEYGRFLFVYHITTNAARDAARFAVVHTSGGTMPGEPAAVTTADVQSVWQTGMFNNKAYGSGMYGMENQITGWTFNVFTVPDTALYATPPDLNPSGKPVWTSAAFHEQIAVQISGTYNPVIPNLLRMGTSIPFTVTVMMGSEAN